MVLVVCSLWAERVTNMGFLDQLRMNNVFNPERLNPNDPLFGGLIPRRQMIPQERIINPVERQAPIPRGIARQSPISAQQPQGGLPVNHTTPPMNVEVRYPDADNKYKDAALRLERDKLNYALSKDDRDYGLRETSEMNKVDIEHRKAALDEWKARNPEGEVKVTEDGKLVVINKLTGKSLDTGLKADHLSEEQKIKLQISGQKEVEAERQKGRLKVEDRKDAREALKSGTPISPSQQRVAEDDAATELLRDPKYSWLSKGGHVIVDKDGVHINRPTSMDSDFFGASAEDKKKGVAVIDAFEKEWKSKAKERMNLSRDKVSTKEATSDTNAKIIIVAPDGTEGYWDSSKALPDGYKKK